MILKHQKGRFEGACLVINPQIFLDSKVWAKVIIGAHFFNLIQTLVEVWQLSAFFRFYSNWVEVSESPRTQPPRRPRHEREPCPVCKYHCDPLIMMMMMILDDDDDGDDLQNLYLVKKVAGAWPGLMYTSLCQVPFKITLKLENVVERRYISIMSLE